MFDVTNDQFLNLGLGLIRGRTREWGVLLKRVLKFKLVEPQIIFVMG